MDLKSVLPKASAGDMYAQNAMGLYYDSINDLDNAIDWFRKAADQNLLTAEYNLACKLYERGNHEEGQKMFEKAAERNHPGAIYYLGCIYERNNDCRGITCFKQAASMNHQPAIDALKDLGIYDIIMQNTR